MVPVEALRRTQLVVVILDSIASILTVFIFSLLAIELFPLDTTNEFHVSVLDWMQFIAFFGYFIIPGIIFRGATPAALLFGLRVVNRKMKPLSKTFAGLRSIFMLVVLSFAFCVLVFSLLFGFRAPFDIIFRCRLVYKNSKPAGSNKSSQSV